MPRAVGLDLGSRLLKVVEISGSAKSFKVQKIVVKEIPQGMQATDEARTALVRQAFSEGRFGKDDVCAAFDAGLTVFRDITVPAFDDDKIEKVIRFEAENHLHGRAIEDVVVNWVRLGDTKEGAQVLVFAAPKAALGDRLAILRGAGIEPASMDVDVTALFTACHTTGVFQEHPDVIVAEIGARTTNVLVVGGGSLRAARSFLVGADTFAAGLQEDLALPEGEARRQALEGGTEGDLLVPAAALDPATRETSKSVAELERDAVSARREEFVRKLTLEITRTRASARTSQAPTRVLLSGGGSLLPGLARSLQESLEIPVEPLGLLGRVGWKSTTAGNAALEEAVAPVAIGCALRLLGSDPLGVELRQEEFAPKNLFDVIRVPLAVAVTLLVVVLVGLAFGLQKSGDMERDRYLRGVCSQALSIYKDVESNYQVVKQHKSKEEAGKIVDTQAKRIDSDENYLYSILNGLQSRYRELEQNLGLSKEVPPIQNALLVWFWVGRAFDSIPRNELGYLRINSFYVNQSTATLQLEMDNIEVAERLEKALAADPDIKAHAKKISRQNFSLDPASKRNKGSINIEFGDNS